MTRPPTAEELDRAESEVLARGETLENLDWLAFMFFTHRRVEKAQAYYLRLVERAPENASYRFYLGEVYWMAGDRAKAREQWEQVMRLDRGEYGQAASRKLASG
jgi:tetratricopeptide (TPR) repeat protein